ncbi:MAG: thiamine phosphate synthase, partial [Candidatus Krumholzibacteria bacterium]|nr:thiamine phosphate synthase [Candidatus Krumholzibacteria bacterium]
KLIDPELADEFKKLRFNLYTLERDFFAGREKGIIFPLPPFLYAIMDRAFVSKQDILSVTVDLIEGGVDLIQYRAKDASRSEMRSDLLGILAGARDRPVPVIVNDDPELASETGADGVHLGSEDPSPESSRALLGPNRIIGVTVHTIAEVDSVPAGVVDYVSVGSIFPSETKPDIEPLGPEFLRQVRKRVDLPIVAIGGIDASNIDAVLDEGADGVALISSLLVGDVRKNCFTLREIIDRRKKKKE